MTILDVEYYDNIINVISIKSIKVSYRNKYRNPYQNTLILRDTSIDKHLHKTFYFLKDDKLL